MKDSRRKKPQVGENEVAEVVSQWTKIPVKKLAEEESAKLRKLEAVLHKRVVGQEEAVSAVAKAVRRGRVGLKGPQPPYWFLPFLRTNRRRKDRNIQGTCRGNVRQRKCHDSGRYV